MAPGAPTSTIDRAVPLSFVTEESFGREVLSSDLPVVVDFFAHWCGPCQWMEPVLEELAEERAGELKVVKVNVDKQPELAARYGAMRLPTVLRFEGGEVVARSVGGRRKAGLEKALGLGQESEPGARTGLLARLGFRRDPSA